MKQLFIDSIARGIGNHRQAFTIRTKGTRPAVFIQDIVLHLIREKYLLAEVTAAKFTSFDLFAVVEDVAADLIEITLSIFLVHRFLPITG